MLRASTYLIILGILFILAGILFYTPHNQLAQNDDLARWPVFTGIILVMMGGTFNLATRETPFRKQSPA